MTDRNRYPKGHTAESIREILNHYETQSPADAAAEIHAADEADATFLEVPDQLVPVVRELIALYERRFEPATSSQSAKTRRSPGAARRDRG